MFSILSDRIDGANVLDLYAGTGALGFEALSRGAAHATFVEAHRPTAQALRDTARDLGLAERTTVVAARAERAAAALGARYDLVFADPPYADPYPQRTFATLRACGAIDAASVVVYEHSSRVAAPADPGFRVERTAIYGEVALAFLRAEAA